MTDCNCFRYRNKRFKLIWGFPGWTDGYDSDFDFAFTIPYYQDVANGGEGKRRKKRGGPYSWMNEQMPFFINLTTAMRVDEDDLISATPSGFMQLYDLKSTWPPTVCTL